MKRTTPAIKQATFAICLSLVLLFPQFGRCFYDPSSQRWLNRDPIGELGGIDLYQFVGNNPISHVDPDGRHPLFLAFIAGFVWAAVMAEEPANAPGMDGFGYPALSLPQHLEAGLAGGMLNVGFAGAGMLTDGVPGPTPQTTPEYLSAPTIKNPVLPKCEMIYGPYYHTARNLGDWLNIQQSGVLGGAPARNIFSSDIPAVKAFTVPSGGPLEFEFTTTVQPKNFFGFQTGTMTWSGPGVTVNQFNWAEIPITVTRVNAPPTAAGN